MHSYAYAVLRRAAERAGDAPPRLITSAEQDVIIRELLAATSKTDRSRPPPGRCTCGPL